MDRFKSVKKPEFGVHLQFDNNMTDYNGIIKRIAVETAEATDNLIFEAITRIAEEQGITDLYILNKQNIAEALKKQIPKRVEEKRYMYTLCECGYEFSEHHGDGYYSIPYEKKTKYCPNCGQALDWGQEE